MARTHGKNVNYAFNSVNLEGELSQVVQTVDVSATDITSFADVYQNSLAGKKSVTTEITGSFNPSAGGGDITLYNNINNGAAATSVFDPTGSGPGTNDPEFQCTASGLTGALVSSYRMSFPVGDKASYTATIQHSGLTTRAVS
jgi:hypothetical protein